MVFFFFIVNTQGVGPIIFLGKGSPAGQVLPASGMGTGRAELETPLVDVEGTDEVRNACPRLNSSSSGSLGIGPRPVSKSRRSVVMKCSPPTIFDGSEQGIIGRLL